MTRKFAVPSQPSTTVRQSPTSTSSLPPQAVTRSIATPPTPSSGPSSPTSTPLTGFLGSTSYAAVFTEQQASLDVNLLAQYRSSTSQPQAPQRAKQDEDRIRAGISLLSLFRELDILERFVEHWYIYAHGLPIMAPVVRIALASLRTNYGEMLSRPDNDASLANLAEKIFENTSLTMKVSPYISAQEYAALFVGENLRWEILGIIVTLVGASATTLVVENPLWAEVEARHQDLKQFIARVVEASNTSLSLVSSDGEANDLLAWLIYDNFMLMTVYHGDSSKCYSQEACARDDSDCTNRLNCLGSHG